MMVDNDQDLGLSLGLPAYAHRHRFPLQLSLMPCATSPYAGHHQKSPSNDLLATPTASGVGERGIDVNQATGGGGGSEEEEEAGVSSPYSAVSNVIGKRGGSERDVQNGEENEMERDSWRGISDEYDDEGSRKKLRLSKDQSVILEESFKEHNTLNPKQKLALAK